MSRSLLVAGLLVVFVVVPFLIWGDQIDLWLSVDGKAGTIANHDTYAWLVGILLLIADLAIPVPTTAVVAALGLIYGPVLGAGFAIVGSVMSALIGFGLGKYLGRPLTLRVFGASLDHGEALFARYGGWIVAASRWLPVLPEVVSVTAGLHKMPGLHFILAVLCGVIPFSMAFASLGHVGAETPLLTLAIAAVAPVILWFALVRSGVIRRFQASPRNVR